MGNCSTKVNEFVQSFDLTDVRKTSAVLLAFYEDYDRLSKHDKGKYDEAIKSILTAFAGGEGDKPENKKN
jgi:hypothetical protein